MSARYLYCVVDEGSDTWFGGIGIEGNEVYTIAFKDIAAVVHNCNEQPYSTENEGKAKEWVLAHLHTIDEAARRFGTPLPFRFDTILKGGGEGVLEWLREEYPELKHMLEKVRGRAEYGVQVYCERSAIEGEVRESSEVKRLEKEVEGKPEGMAYMLRRKAEKKIKEEFTAEMSRLRENFYRRIEVCVSGVKVEKALAEPEEKQDEVLNLSCLADRGQAEELGEVLEEIDSMEGFTVLFSGPWPPFSFSGGGMGEAGKE